MNGSTAAATALLTGLRRRIAARGLDGPLEFDDMVGTIDEAVNLLAIGANEEEEEPAPAAPRAGTAEADGTLVALAESLAEFGQLLERARDVVDAARPLLQVADGHATAPDFADVAVHQPLGQLRRLAGAIRALEPRDEINALPLQAPEDSADDR